MSLSHEPALGKWYKDDEQQYFEIVALDSDDKTIEIQYFDGTIEELDYDVWFEKGMILHAAPEDWSGPFDDLERDDFGDTDDVAHATNFDEEIDSMD